MRYLLVLLITLTAGCATDHVAMQKQIDAALKERPLVAIECPESGCVMRSFTVNNPNQVVLPKITNGWDTATTLGTAFLGVVDKAGTMYLVTETVKEGFRYVRSNDNSVVTTTTTTTSTNTSDSNNVSSVTDTTDGSYNQSSSSVTDTVADSYNTPTSTNTTSTDTYTSTSNITDTTTTTTPTITGDNNEVN